MSVSLNKVFLAGGITQDPQSKAVGTSTLCTFPIAVNRKFTTQAGEEREETAFIDIETWGKVADSCAQYCYSGMQVFIEGRLKFEQWENQGQKRSKLLVTAERVQFLSPARGQQGAAAAPPPQQGAPLPVVTHPPPQQPAPTPVQQPPAAPQQQYEGGYQDPAGPPPQ